MTLDSERISHVAVHPREGKESEGKGSCLKLSSAQCKKDLEEALPFCARATTKPFPRTKCAP